MKLTITLKVKTCGFHSPLSPLCLDHHGGLLVQNICMGRCSTPYLTLRPAENKPSMQISRFLFKLHILENSDRQHVHQTALDLLEGAVFRLTQVYLFTWHKFLFSIIFAIQIYYTKRSHSCEIITEYQAQTKLGQHFLKIKGCSQSEYHLSTQPLTVTSFTFTGKI